MGIFDKLFIWKVQNVPEPSRAVTQQQLREINSEAGLLNGAIINNKIFDKEEYEAHIQSQGMFVKNESVREMNDKYAQLRENLKERTESFEVNKDEYTKPQEHLEFLKELENLEAERADQGTFTKDDIECRKEMIQESNYIINDLQIDINTKRDRLEAIKSDPDLLNGDPLNTAQGKSLNTEIERLSNEQSLHYNDIDENTSYVEEYETKFENYSEEFKHDFDAAVEPGAPKPPKDIEMEI